MSCPPVNVLAPEEVLTTPKVRFLDTRQQSLHALVRKCTPDDVRVLKDAAAKWLAEMPQAGKKLWEICILRYIHIVGYVKPRIL